MKSTLSLRRRMGLGRAKVAARSEVLEGRTLLSAWGTVATYSYPGGSPRLNSGGSVIETAPYDMVADGAGNLYASGQAYDSTGTPHAILLERFAGTPLTSWSTISDIPNADFNKMAVDSAGDLLVTGHTAPLSNGAWFVAVRAAGQSSFTIVNDPLGGHSVPGIALDGSGNAYLDGGADETVNGVTQQHWVVQKAPVSQLVSGQAAFTTVDDFYSLAINMPHGITCVPSGTAAGIYVVGQTGSNSNNANWVVRKSTNGGSTWSTIDSFTSSLSFARANGVSADLSGNNLYVVGYTEEVVKVRNKSTTNTHWLVRKSSNGGATWTVADDYAGPGVFSAWKIQPDRLGNMYVVGEGTPGSTADAVIRANTGTSGAWVTVDDYSGGSGTTAYNLNLLVDSANNHFACGTVSNSNNNTASWLIRSDASLTASPSAVAAVFSSTQVSGGTDVTDLLKRKHRHG